MSDYDFSIGIGFGPVSSVDLTEEDMINQLSGFGTKFNGGGWYLLKNITLFVTPINQKNLSAFKYNLCIWNSPDARAKIWNIAEAPIQVM